MLDGNIVLITYTSAKKHFEGQGSSVWISIMAAAQVAKKLKDKRQKNYIEGIFKKVIIEIVWL